jgi:hypothetical protein
MEGEVKSCALGKMIGEINEMKKTDKWGFIMDTNGNVGTFMKYKASHTNAWNYLKSGVPPKEENMARKLFSALQGGGIMCFDLDLLGAHPDMKYDYFLKDEWFPKVHNYKEFLVYEHLSDVVGPKYQALVDEIIGAHKVLYTDKSNPFYIVYVAKTDKIPKWAEGKFTYLKVT